MKTNFSVRPAKLPDCPAVQRLGCVPEIAIAPNYYLPLQYYRRVIRGKHIFLVAEVKEKIVGFCIGEKLVSGILGQYIVVAKPYRKHGIARALLEKMEQAAKKRGAYYMLGYAVTDSPGINKLLKEFGYQSSHLTREWSKGLRRPIRPRKK